MQCLDFEVELAFVIGKRGKHIKVYYAVLTHSVHVAFPYSYFIVSGTYLACQMGDGAYNAL